MILSWVRNFKWDSLDQMKGHLAFVTWARTKKVSQKVRPIDLFLIQKDIESHDYWRELVGSQVTRMENQIFALQKELRKLRSKMGDTDE